MRSLATSVVACAVLAAAVAHAAADAGPRPIEPIEPADAGTASIGDAGTLGTASGLVMKARVEPDPVKFGDRFELVVEIVRPAGEPLVLPGTTPENDGCQSAGDARRTVEELAPGAPVPVAPIPLAPIPVAPTPVDAGTHGGDSGSHVLNPVHYVKETLRFPFLALDTQEVKTPALLLTAKDGSTLDVPSLPVRVDVPPDTTADGGPLLGPDGGPVQPGQVPLESAAATIAYRVPDQRPWVVVSALFSSALALVIVRFVQRRLKLRAPAQVALPPPPPRPAHEIALERLEALLASGMLTRGETGTFVERLMDEVLRDYLQARFMLPAGTRTTRELVKDLLGVSVAGLDVALVDDLLKDADLVKFAKASIPSDRAHAMAVRVRTLVEATAVRPAPNLGGAR